MFKRQQVRGAIDRQAEQEKKDGLKNLAFMALALIMAIAVGAFFYFSPFMKPDVEQTTTKEVQPKPVQDEAPANTYEFYEILPKQEFQGIPRGMSEKSSDTATKPLKVDTVVVQEQEQTGEALQVIPSEAPPLEQTEEQPKSPTVINIQKANPNSTYVLQVRSYETADSAELKRAEVMMAGVDATVLTRDDGNGGTLYTVVSMPMASRDEAMTAYNRLQVSGIDSVVVEQRYQRN